MVRRTVLVMLAAAASALSGCTSDDNAASVPTTSTTAALRDACSLLRAASVEQVIGKPFRPGAPADRGAARTCVFDAADGSGTVSVSLAAGSDAAFDQLRSEYPDAATVSLRTDEAFWSDRLHTLVARDGQLVVTISLNLKDVPPDQLPWATDLADEALAAV